MDPIFAELARYAPPAALVLYIWQQTREERKEWRAWWEARELDFKKIIEANTNALNRNSEVLGEANAARWLCHRSNGGDEAAEKKEQFSRRRGGNGAGQNMESE